MAAIRRIELIAIGPDVPRYRYTEALDAPHTTTTIVRVVDGEGVEGVGGYDADSWGGFELASFETLRAWAGRLVARDAEAREAIADELRWGGTSPFLPGPLSAIDIALWDLAAKRAELPLCRLLGGAVDALPAYASIPSLADPGAYLELIEEVREQGFGAVKAHATGDPDRDIAIHTAIHEAHPGLEVMHDAEGVYDRDGALRVGRALDELGARWFEAPLSDFDLPGYRGLRAAIDTPVLPAGDAVWELRQFAEALRDPPWDAIRSDVTLIGGITPGAELMALAAAHALDVELVSYGHTLVQAANLHAMLAFGRSGYFEQAYPMEAWEFGALNPIRADERGMVRSPKGTGLGVSLDWDALGSATIASAAFP